MPTKNSTQKTGATQARGMGPIKDLDAKRKGGSVKGGNFAEVRTAQSQSLPIAINVLDAADQVKPSGGPGPGVHGK